MINFIIAKSNNDALKHIDWMRGQFLEDTKSWIYKSNFKSMVHHGNVADLMTNATYNSLEWYLLVDTYQYSEWTV